MRPADIPTKAWSVASALLPSSPLARRGGTRWYASTGRRLVAIPRRYNLRRCIDVVCAACAGGARATGSGSLRVLQLYKVQQLRAAARYISGVAERVLDLATTAVLLARRGFL